jgi:glycosyltransferase involved in cell wall biosynthesis
VQYVNYPWDTFAAGPAGRRWYHPVPLVRAYAALCRALAGFTVEGMRRNVTLVNSDWIGRLVQARYGIATRTVYPPVVAPPAAGPWETREPGFVCIGRISPEKELDRVLDIVGAVRREVPAARLHLVGTATDPLYRARIVHRARAEGAVLHEDLTREALHALLARQRYGIHGMREEHFGMAPAEMVAAGCLVWVPAGGGQVEIVGDDRLTYGSVEEAVARILAVLRSPAEASALRAHLAARAPRFGTARFVREIREVVTTAGRR